MYFHIDEIRKLNPWRDLPEAPPLVLRNDRPAMEKYNTDRHDPEAKARLETPPGPFVGSPDTARVLLLTKSPPWDGNAAADQADNPEYAKAARRNLTFGNEEYPFYFLNPAFAETSGYQWWQPKLLDLIEACREKVGDEAQKLVAERVMTVAYFPYHVEQYGGEVEGMPSQRYAWQMVRVMAEKGLPVIVLAHDRLWGKQLQRTQGEFIRARISRGSLVNKRNLPDGQFETLVDKMTA